MAPPPLSPTIRYFPPGTRKVYWVVTISNYLAPTRAEINAGVDLSAEISALNGWSLTSASVDTPDMGSRFTSQVPGRLSSSTNEITCYMSQNSIDARQVMTRDANGYVILLWEGDVAGQKMDVFPVRVQAQAPDSATDNPGTCTFSYAATRLPAIGITIPV